MALFKSAEERRIERDIKIRQGIRRIEKSIREQGKFQEEFIRNAQHAKRIGDAQQYAFIRNSLKKTAAIRKMEQSGGVRPAVIAGDRRWQGDPEDILPAESINREGGSYGAVDPAAETDHCPAKTGLVGVVPQAQDQGHPHLFQRLRRGLRLRQAMVCDR